jgi:hypothetical protein
MDRALESRLASKPQVKGVLCADSNGLLISAKGELESSSQYSGRYASILRHAASLAVDQPPPTVVLETYSKSVVIRDYDNLTLVMRVDRNMED